MTLNKFYITILFSFLLMNCKNTELDCDAIAIDIDFDFSGRIKDCFFDENGRGTPAIIFNDGKLQYIHAHSLVCFAQSGDSVFKKKGSLNYYLIRDSNIITFYTECGNMQIRDSGITFINKDYKADDCGKRKPIPR